MSYTLASPTPPAAAVPLPSALQPAQNMPQGMPQGMAQGTEPAATNPALDPELAKFFVTDMSQQAPQPYAQQQYAQQPYAQPQYAQQPPQSYAQQPSDDALSRIEQGQRALLAAMRQNTAGAEQANAAPAPSQYSLPLGADVLTDAERKALGQHADTLQEFMHRRLKQTIEPAMAQMYAAVQEQQRQQAQLNERIDATRTTTMRQVLSASIPNFDQTLNQPQFKEYLQSVSPETGAPRLHIIQQAVRNGDVDLIRTHVNMYRAQYGIVDNAPNPAAQAMQAMQHPMAQPNAGYVSPQTAPTITPEAYQQAMVLMTKGQLKPEKFEQLTNMFRHQQSQHLAQQQQMRTGQRFI